MVSGSSPLAPTRFDFGSFLKKERDFLNYFPPKLFYRNFFYNTKAAKELARFGGQAKNKVLFREVMFAPPEEQLELLKRWVIGDGNQCEGDVRIFTSSLVLAMQLRDLLARQRIHFRIYQRKWETIIMRGKKYNTKGGFDFGISGKDAAILAIKNIEFKRVNRGYCTYYSGNWLLLPVKGISTKIYTGSVHNLKVTTDNTYTVDGIVVHNCAVGYDDEKKLIKFKNSWSTKWGDKGFGYLSYEYIQRYMMDAWSSVDIEDLNPLTLASVLSLRERTLV